MAVSDETIIQVTNMNKWYGDFHVLRDINLEVKKREERIVVCAARRVPESRRSSAA